VNLAAAVGLAREGRLYPSLILHGATLDERIAAAQQLARTLLCTAELAQRPCGVCRHCRRIDFAPAAEVFHPDVALLRRDLKTATSTPTWRCCAATSRPRRRSRRHASCCA
jgi:hypothetical protein